MNPSGEAAISMTQKGLSSSSRSRSILVGLFYSLLMIATLTIPRVKSLECDTISTLSEKIWRLSSSQMTFANNASTSICGSETFRFTATDNHVIGTPDITLCYQQKVDQGEQSRNSMNKLFQKVNVSRITTPIFTTFKKLLQNYDNQSSYDPMVTTEGRRDLDNFFAALLATETMNSLYQFLNCKGIYSNVNVFRNKLKAMWFGRASTSNANDVKSGFKHVFVGERKGNNVVTGLHNWYRLYLLEQSEKLDYIGYNSTGNPNILSVVFRWDGSLKNISSIFLGSSPDMDFALYTLCFALRRNTNCVVTLGGHQVTIKTFDNNGLYIRTAYPVVTSSSSGAQDLTTPETGLAHGQTCAPDALLDHCVTGLTCIEGAEVNGYVCDCPRGEQYDDSTESLNPCKPVAQSPDFWVIGPVVVVVIVLAFMTMVGIITYRRRSGMTRFF